MLPVRSPITFYLIGFYFFIIITHDLPSFVVRYYGRFQPFGRLGRRSALHSHRNHLRHFDYQFRLHQRRLLIRRLVRRPPYEGQVRHNQRRNMAPQTQIHDYFFSLRSCFTAAKRPWLHYTTYTTGNWIIACGRSSKKEAKMGFRFLFESRIIFPWRHRWMSVPKRSFMCVNMPCVRSRASDSSVASHLTMKPHIQMGCNILIMEAKKGEKKEDESQ